jgi:glycosyltransferase involved in cell wall biosynthesis
MRKVNIVPSVEDFAAEESGIKRVIEAYTKYLPLYDWEVVGKDQPYDIRVSHAGAAPAHVAHLHGLYWTANYLANNWEWRANRDIADSIRSSQIITVPSSWVAETIKRDMHVNPFVLGHGIDWDKWQESVPFSDFYVLWNKNRTGDVCDPTPFYKLAQRFPETRFISTFAPIEARGMNNVLVTGLMPHHEMMQVVKQAGIYLSTTKETFGIGILEAMASGVPVLGYAEGGICDLVQHGVNGYLAVPGNLDDLTDGLAYCLQHNKVLGSNGREMARQWTWERAVQKVAIVYDLASVKPPPTVAVIIPTYNYKEKVIRAIMSACDQTRKPDEIIIVDDGSTDGTYEQLVSHKNAWAIDYPDIIFTVIQQSNQGVACARNNGIAHAPSKYICCLDADDAIAPEFLEVCVNALELDPALGIAYTGLYMIDGNGKGQMSTWPGKFNYDAQLKRQNQVPTCCVFKRTMWERTGGYRQRYAPDGAGSEDAEFWLHGGALGYNAKQVTEGGLFIYSFGTGRVSANRDYHERDWMAYHPWVIDEKHPFASIATPVHFSHPVRQYDQPQVSVIIPVGPGHKHLIGNAIDSIEAQTFREWELIVVDDTVDPDERWIFDGNDEITKAWPFIRFAQTNGKQGAGAARNLGASIARAPLLLFLDADDWLFPTALEKMVMGWNASGQIVYSDYIAKCYLSQEEANKAMASERLKEYNPVTQDAIIINRTLDFDCDMAVNQPDENLYIWCLISALVPKVWHNLIGGFDETMPAWEDWQYFIDLARAGYCFTRIPEPLMIYRFATGQRREFAEPSNTNGRQNARKLLKYMADKRKKAEIKMCGCHGKNLSGQQLSQARPAYGSTPSRSQGAVNSMPNSPTLQDADFVEIMYQPGHDGDHSVIGLATRINYQRHQTGDVFLVHVKDIEANPEYFVHVAAIKNVPVQPAMPTPPPTPIVKVKQFQEAQHSNQKELTIEAIAQDDLQELPGVNVDVVEIFNAAGLYSFQDILDEGIDGLTGDTIGLSKTKATAIIKAIKLRMGQE